MRFVLALALATLAACGGGAGGEMCDTEQCDKDELCCPGLCGSTVKTCFKGATCPVATCDMGIHDMPPKD